MATLGDSSWSKRALYGMRDQLLEVNASLAESLIKSSNKSLSLSASLDAWCQSRPKRVEKMDRLMQELKSLEKIDLNMVFVASHHLSEMT